jgi:raffinose/stachyose/melibiose transport system permease protein
MTGRLGSFGRHVTLLVVVAFFAIPFYMVVANAFKEQQQIVRNPLAPPTPETFTLSNFERALSDPAFSLAFAYGFSAMLAVTAVGLALLFGSGLSYWIARRDHGRARIAYLTMLLTLMVPPHVLVVPVVRLLDALGLLFTVPGLVIYDVAIKLPLTVFVYVGYVRTVPKELDEAASIDGAGLLRTFWQVIFPLLRPATVSLAVLLTVFTWNDFINPQIILGGSGAYTVTTGVYRAVGLYSSDFGEVFAFINLSAGPMLLLFLLAQKYIVGGLASGSTKG